MKKFSIELNDEEFKKINEEYPQSKSSNPSALIGNRAEELIKIYFSNIDKNAKFSKPKDGADLIIKYKDKSEEKELKIEIKGTAQDSLNKNNIKVTGTQSYKCLTEENIPIYRVTGVFNKKPTVYIMHYKVDYELLPENRWTAR